MAPRGGYQIAQDGSARTYVTSYDHTKGQPGFFGGGGVWKVDLQSQFGDFSPFAGLSQVASFAGLAGDLPTSTALGPDGKLYVGFLKNGNIKRVVNPAVLNPSSANQFSFGVNQNCLTTIGSGCGGKITRQVKFGLLGFQAEAKLEFADACVHCVRLHRGGAVRLYFSIR